jgi:hypothetical protein
VSAIPCGNHYLLDVLAGLVVGILAIVAGAGLYPRLANFVTPLKRVNSASVAVVVCWRCDRTPIRQSERQTKRAVRPLNSAPRGSRPRALSIKRMPFGPATSTAYKPRSIPAQSVIGWKLFSILGGRVISYGVCATVDMVASCTLRPPTVQTTSGITKLWARRYGQIRHIHSEPWRLTGGTVLQPDSLIFETHLSTRALGRARLRGLSVEQIDSRETLELVSLLEGRSEVALVGRATLRGRLSSMGWAVRETPSGIYRDCDTFLRRLYLLAAKGPNRAARDEGPVAEVAISLTDFIARGKQLSHGREPCHADVSCS